MTDQTGPKPPSTPAKTGQKPADSSQRIPPKILEELPPEIFERLPEETKIALVEARSLRGPLPPPSLSRQYDEVLPGSAERILRLAEKARSQRHDWDNKALDYEGREIIRGQWLGFVLGGFGRIAATSYAHIGESWVAAIVAGGTIAGILPACIRKQSD